MDTEQTNNNNSPYYGYKTSRSNAFMIVSMCFGILAFATSTFIFAALVFGGLSIIFAILSKGNDIKMQIMPKVGIITSCLAIVLSICITTAAFVLVFSNPTYKKQLNEMCEQMYGESFDDMLKQAYPQIQLKEEPSSE